MSKISELLACVEDFAGQKLNLETELCDLINQLEIIRSAESCNELLCEAELERVECSIYAVRSKISDLENNISTVNDVIQEYLSKDDFS